jgi:hypothetical protein
LEFVIWNFRASPDPFGFRLARLAPSETKRSRKLLKLIHTETMRWRREILLIHKQIFFNPDPFLQQFIMTVHRRPDLPAAYRLIPNATNLRLSWQ